MVKVRLPLEIAKALDYTIKNRGKSWMRNYPNMGKVAKTNSQYATIVRYVQEDDKNFEILQNATVNGFEYDLTPEQELVLYYKKLQSKPIYQGSLEDIVKETLDILGKKVKGINC